MLRAHHFQINWRDHSNVLTKRNVGSGYEISGTTMGKLIFYICLLLNGAHE